MRNEFCYSGGSFSSGLKFFAMLVVGGREEFVYNLEKSGQVIKTDYYNNYGKSVQMYQTNLEIVKIFLYIPFSHNQKITQSYYVRMEAEEDSDVIEVVPPTNSTLSSYDRGNCFFRCSGRFLTRNEVLGILSADSPSIRYVKTQRLAPKELLKQMIKITRVTPSFSGRLIAMDDQ
jgi:hypothetical protein